MLKSRDIETGQDVQDLIQTGEFFGVKSAMGHFPREEDATALSNAQTVAFSVPEFETLVTTNLRVSLKMLKVFSNQLRRIHSKVSSMLNTLDEIDPEKGLFNSGEFYFKNKNFPHALYIFKRYLDIYPSGRYAEQAAELRSKSEQFDSMKNAGKPASAVSEGAKGLSGAGKVFFEGENHLANERFDDAIAAFKRVLSDYPDDSEYHIKAEMEIGRSLQAKGDHPGAIRHTSQLVQKNPKMPNVAEALFLIGKSYRESGDRAKAQSFLKRAESVVGDNSALKRKIARALAESGN